MVYDKKWHCFGSLAVCIVLSFFLPLTIAAGITFALGIIKEVVYGWLMGKGTPEWADLAYDFYGVMAAVIIRLELTF